MPNDEIYQSVIDDFAVTGSVKQTAKNVGTTLVRAQRILITEGLWSSKTSENVGRLYAEGKNVPDIAKELFISEKTVQAYLPYTRSEKGYGGENRSNEAIRSEEYRQRQQQAHNNQVLNKELDDEKRDTKAYVANPNGMSYEMIDLDIVSKEEMLIMRENLDVQNKKNTKKSDILASDYFDAYMDKNHRVLRLSLELNMKYLSPEDKVVLNRYGKVMNGITREILVPGDITLHALHYAIQRAFGWQNSHLHCFKLSDEAFQRLTGGKNKTDKFGMINYDGKFVDWIKYCGVYFRYPTEEYEDIYWDDDYEEGVSFKTWLRRKYTGTYKYGGEWEHYRQANAAARDILKRFPTIDVVDFIHNSKPIAGNLGAFNEKRNTIPMREATIQDFQYGFEGSLDELLERIPVVNLLVPKGITIDEKIYERIADICEEQRISLIELPVMPVTDEIIYAYDYGDGWEVSIKMTDCYYTKDSWDTMTESKSDRYFIPPIKEKAIIDDQRAYNLNDKYVGEELSKTIATVAIKKKPICIALDGLSVIDDVGGVHGYIDFLMESRLSLPPERDEIREWAKGMGWNGRMSKPESLL